MSVANRFFVFLIGACLCASAYAQAPENPRTALSTSAVSAAAKAERVPVAAVDIEAHLKSRVVTSVTVGAPIEQTAPAQVEAPTVALKAVVAVR